MMNERNLQVSKKQTQLDRAIEQMFQNECQKVFIEEVEPFDRNKMITTVTAVLMSTVVLLSFLYKLL